MILCSEREDEAFVIENEWDVAIPVSFSVIDGECRISCYPSVEQEVRDFYEQYKDDLFSDTALADLWGRIDFFFKKHGYGSDRFRDRWGYVFRGTAEDSTLARRLSAADEDINETTYDIEASVEDGRLAFGVLENGKVVSVAVTHTPIEDGLALSEVGVETVPSSRKRGYAAASLRALSAYLGRCGIETEYRCQRYNTGSYRVAEAAGLRLAGKYYYYVGRKK